MEKELKKAVAFIKLDIKNGFNDLKIKDSPALIYSIDCLISLAESFFSLKGFPEEKEVRRVTHNRKMGLDGVIRNVEENIIYDNWESGYNQALKEMKLALLKKMDGISNVIISSAYPFLPTETETKVIKALKDHLTK